MKPQYDKYTEGLMPCIIQDAVTLQVLMLGFMNKEAFEKTITEKKVTFYSRSKSRLWTKGESTGNYLLVQNIQLDCDEDTILIQALPQGPTCHTGAVSCFATQGNIPFTIATLDAIITNRIANPSVNSYVSNLINKGINKVAQKVGEEAVELVIESKDDNEELFIGEAADLLFHYLILLQTKKCTLQQVYTELKKRHNK